MTPDEIASLVSEGAKLDRAKVRLKVIRELMASLPPGEYVGETPADRAKVIAPAMAIKPSSAAIEKVRALLDQDLFKKLFFRMIIWKPVENFRSVVAAVLTPAKAENVVHLCEIESAPYVIFL